MPDQRPIALVTGAARRVGRATSVALARAGCDLIVTYRTSEEEARSLLEELELLGAGATAERLDLSDLDQTASFADRLADRSPALDALVHNASLYTPSPLGQITADDALRHYRINALAPLLLTQGLAPALERSERPGGAGVVAMCDIHAMGRPRKGFAAYTLSKAALVEMVRTLARDLAPNVRVNGVAPGVVAFPESGYESDEEAQRKYLSRVPLERSGTPEDAAEAVRWLALDARYTTGQIIRVDGGRWLA